MMEYIAWRAQKYGSREYALGQSNRHKERAWFRDGMVPWTGAILILLVFRLPTRSTATLAGSDDGDRLHGLCRARKGGRTSSMKTVPHYVLALAMALPAILLGVEIPSWLSLRSQKIALQSDLRVFYTPGYMLRTGQR